MSVLIQLLLAGHTPIKLKSPGRALSNARAAVRCSDKEHFESSSSKIHGPGLASCLQGL